MDSELCKIGIKCCWINFGLRFIVQIDGGCNSGKTFIEEKNTILT